MYYFKYRADAAAHMPSSRRRNAAAVAKASYIGKVVKGLSAMIFSATLGFTTGRRNGCQARCLDLCRRGRIGIEEARAMADQALIRVRIIRCNFSASPRKISLFIECSPKPCVSYRNISCRGAKMWQFRGSSPPPGRRASQRQPVRSMLDTLLRTRSSSVAIFRNQRRSAGRRHRVGRRAAAPAN